MDFRKGNENFKAKCAILHAHVEPPRGSLHIRAKTTGGPCNYFCFAAVDFSPVHLPGCQVSYFSPKFLFFPIFQQFFSTFILFFSQKLKEVSKIRRISYSGKSHSCEIASLWSFPPKWSHDQPASVVLPQSWVLIHSFMTVHVFGRVFCVYFRIYERKLLMMLTSQICRLACTLMKQRQHR